MSLVDHLMGNKTAIFPEELNGLYGHILAQNEEFIVGFKSFRDSILFTSKRLILVDVQGLTGSKIEFMSVPYSSITAFSLETKGTFDMDSDLKMWVGSNLDSFIQRKLSRKIDIATLNRLLATHILG